MAFNKNLKCGRLVGSIDIPASKSITHRACILAALSKTPVNVHHPLDSDDTNLTLAALKKLGYPFKRTDYSVHFSGKREKDENSGIINVGDSGTTARLICAVAATTPGKWQIDGSSRMRERPMQPLFTALKALGADIRSEGHCLPVTICGKELNGGNIQVDVSKSSQFLSALLLIAPLLSGNLNIKTSDQFVSKSYVDLTVEYLQKAGTKISVSENVYKISANWNIQLPDLTVPGDFSSASYFMVGAAISGGNVQLKNLDPESVQGDRYLVDILQMAGAEVHIDADAVRVSSGSLKPIDVNMNSCPDIVPTVAVLAMFADGRSRLRNIGHLQFKESDRIAAIISNIEKLGGNARLEGEDLVITPAAYKGAVLESYNDHRMAMSFAVAGLKIPGVIIENPDCVQKSYPEFWRDFDQLIQPINTAKI